MTDPHGTLSTGTALASRTQCSEPSTRPDVASGCHPNRVVAPEKRGMSMIFQSYAIWPNMTVAQNVAFGLKLRKLPAHRIDSSIDR